MGKLRVKIVIIGHLPFLLNRLKLIGWKSDVFDIDATIDSYPITSNADGDNWEYTDRNIANLLPESFDGDFLVAMTSVPLQHNYYARRLDNNRVCVTFHEMADILRSNNIPLENLIYRQIYSYSVLYMRNGKKIPSQTEGLSFMHDETRGCLFDMNGIKSDIAFSTVKPQICASCVYALTNNIIASCRVPKNLIDKIQDELLIVNKGGYYKISDWIKENPVRAIVISTLSAFLLNLLASYMYDALKLLII